MRCGMYHRSAYSVIRRCVHRQTNNQFAVKIIDVAKYAANPKLSTEGYLYVVFVYVSFFYDMIFSGIFLISKIK